MKKQKINYFFLTALVAIACLLPSESRSQGPIYDLPLIIPQEDAKAKVIKIDAERKIDSQIEQRLLVKILTGTKQGKEYLITYTTQPAIGLSTLYKEGDIVLVHLFPAEAEASYIIGIDRSGVLYSLLALFIIVVIGIGRWKGVRSLIGLGLSFVIIMYGIIPPIMNGTNPLAISLLGAIGILALLLYTSEGWKPRTHLALLSIGISLSVTFVLSLIFTAATRLTGIAQEEAQYLVGLVNGATVDFKGLLLAGVLIGAVGVLDDAIVAQIEAVKQIKQANPLYNRKQLFNASFAIGKTHLGAIVNTLFLTYAGASLPILILFYANRSEPLGYTTALNSEVIATELVRTLVGSIGVALSLPIATALASWWYTHSDQDQLIAKA